MTSETTSVPESPERGEDHLAHDEVVFDGAIAIDYGQFYFRSSESTGDFAFEEAFVGQTNGLCGAAEPEKLVFITGPNVGDPPLRVVTHTSEPAANDEWDDVVEVSLVLTRPTTYSVVQFTGETVGRPLRLKAGSYRVRYSASGMDEAQAAISDDEDRYLVQCWPAAAGPDEVVKETSKAAAYWRSYFFGS